MKDKKPAKPAPRRDLAVDPKTSAPRREKPVATAEKPKRRLCGLLQRKEKWVLSWRGRIVLWGVLLVLALTFILKVHPFLAVTDRVETQYLVIEGWVPNYALEESIAEFKSKPYVKIFTVGADPLTGVNIEPGDSISFEAYKRLKWLGVNPEQMQPVPAHIKYRNRTYESALALKKWFKDNNLSVTNFNLVTLGAHSRRSRLLFEKAFAGEAQVGIISVEHREYDPKHWWKYSEGVREVIGEGIGYIYARFLFHPSENEDY